MTKTVLKRGMCACYVVSPLFGYRRGSHQNRLQTLDFANRVRSGNGGRSRRWQTTGL